MAETLRRYAPALIVLVLYLALPFVLSSNYQFRVATLICTAALTAVGLNLLMGFAGQVSLGHAGFGGIGGYAIAVLPTHFGWHPLLAFVAGVTAAGLIAFVVGRPILRLRGHYLAVATLGLGILAFMLFQNEIRYTGGPDGMSVPRLELFGVRLRAASTWYWIAGGALVLGIVLAINLVNSPTGRALRAVHDSEVAARVLGIDVPRAKLVVFVVSAVYAAVAGSLLTWTNAFITPDIASFLHSIELVTMAVLGGLGSIVGSVVGAAVLVLLPQLLTVFHEYEHILLGLVLMVTMIFLPNGIVPSILIAWRKRGG